MPNVRKVWSRCVFSMIRGSWCLKNRLGKAAGAEVVVQQRNKKWHAAVSRSAFSSQNVQNTSVPEQFLKVRCRKIARRCGAKHICKSKCTKRHMRGPIFEVPISKNGTPLRRSCKSKFAKRRMFGPLFEVQMSKNCTALWREAICLANWLTD